jgi:hypothetical protein
MAYGNLKADNLVYSTPTGDIVFPISGIAYAGAPLISGVSGIFLSGVTSPIISGVSGIFTTSVSGATVTGGSVLATTITGASISGANITGVSGTFTDRVSGATVTGTSGQFTTATAVTGIFTTTLSGATITGTTAQFANVTGGAAGFTTITGTTVTGTNANFVTVSGTTVTGTTGNFVTVSGTTVTGGIVNDNIGNVRNIPQNSQTASYTLVSGDAGKHVFTTSGVTVPSGVFIVGQAVSIYNNTTGTITITQGTNVTLRQAGASGTGDRTLAQRGLATVLCVSGANGTEFVIGGAGLS